MKLLVVCQYYKPEPFRVDDLCEELVRRGHEVQVVTGYPNYPEGVLYEGYGRGRHIDETLNGVRVHRCYTVPRGTGAVGRLLNYFSFALSSSAWVRSRACVSESGAPFDAVLCYQLSPVLMATAAQKYKEKHRVPAVLYCLDLWPESLLAGAVRKGSVLYRVFHHISRRLYRSMDQILITSRMFSDYLQREFGIAEQQIGYLPQYAEELFEPLPPKQETGTFEFVFAGNLGALQSVETVLQAAGQLQNEPVRFHILGGGSDAERLQRLGAALPNVEFHGRRPLAEMPGWYAKADALLVTLAADPVLSLTLPGKVQSYMAVGRPVIGAINGETRAVIAEAACGFCGPAEDAAALAENLRRFMSNETDRAALGDRARAYYQTHFTKDRFTDQLEAALTAAQKESV